MDAKAVIWYRYDDVSYAAPSDEFGDSRGFGSVEVYLREFTVVRFTPKGAWVNRGCTRAFDSIHGELQFVLLSARKRLCYPTKAEAMTSFIARKKAQIRIYEARAYKARRALDAAKRLMPDVEADITARAVQL